MATAELIAAILVAPDEPEDEWQPALQELQNRPTRETFDAAAQLLASGAMLERELGVEILGQLGGSGSDPDRPFREESVLALLKTLEHEHEPRVLESLGSAFAHLDEPRGIKPLSAFARHPSERVRSPWSTHCWRGSTTPITTRAKKRCTGSPSAWTRARLRSCWRSSRSTRDRCSTARC